MKVGIVAPLSSRFDYFGVPIRNGAVLAFEEEGASLGDLMVLVRDDEGDPELTQQCIAELDEEGVVAVIGPVESHCAAIGAAEARARQLPVVTPSATASYLTADPNPWFFRAISSDRDRTDALARWAMQDLGGAPILVVHETAPSSDDDHPPLYGQSAGRDFVRALDEAGYPYEVRTFERRHVLPRGLRQEAARLLRDGAVAGAAILSPSVNIIDVGEYLRSVVDDLPIYIISPGRDLFARSSITDRVLAVTDTIIEDSDAVELVEFREHYHERFPDEPDDPVAQYATFAHDAARILVAALRRATADRGPDDVPGDGPVDEQVTLRARVRAALEASPARTDLLMSTGNFVAHHDLLFKPSRRVLDGGEWRSVSRDEIRRRGATSPPAEPVDDDAPAARRVYDAFLSYRHLDPDLSFTRELHRRLEDAGFTVALDDRDFHAALTFIEEMERCVKESRFTLLVVSPRYFESGNTVAEAVIGQVLNMQTRRSRLVPVKIEAATMPTWMYGLVGIDFSAEDPPFDPYEKLIETLRGPVPGPPDPGAT